MTEDEIKALEARVSELKDAEKLIREVRQDMEGEVRNAKAKLLL